MNKTYSITLFVILVTIVNITAQSNVEWKKENFPGKEAEFKSAFKTYLEGEKFYYDGPPFYEPALEKYLEANKFNPNNDLLNFHIGHIYFAFHHPKDAEVYYEKAIKLNPKLRELVLFELADAYHQDGEWDNAIAHYQEYKAFIQEGGHKHLNMHTKDIKHELRYADLCIRQCETGKILTHDTIPIIFENISPAINTKYPEYSAVVNHEENILFFVSRRPANVNPRKHHGEAFEYDDVYFSRRTENGWQTGIPIHGEVNSHAHEAPCWVNGDATRLLLYYNKSKKKNLQKQGDIYETYLKEGKWTDPKPMKMLNSSYRETHASISNDGKTIYFTTNNPKYAKHGGMDIVKTTYDEATGKWSKPVDVGSTINTEWDEESPFIKPDDKHFYFSSQGHTSIGGFDFFKCELREDGSFSEPVNLGFPLNTPYDDAFIYVSDDGRRVFFNSTRIGGFGANDIYEGFILSEVDIPVEIIVKDSMTLEVIKNADLKVKESEGRPFFKEIVAANSGTYFVYVGVSKKYAVDVEANGYIPTSKVFNTNFDKMVHLDTLKVTLVVYMQKDEKIEPIAFRGQLFDDITKKPIDGQVTINLGTEKIAELNTVNSLFTADLKTNTQYSITASSNGYVTYQGTFKLYKGDEKKDFYLDKEEISGNMLIKNVYFETAKYNLDDEDIRTLNEVRSYLLSHPTAKIKVEGHTDIVGLHGMNLRLSNNRAKSVCKWFKANGIDEERIQIIKFYGPDRPIADNNTDQGKALNRRTEISITEK